MLKGKDDNLANAARFALERIPSPKADEVLRDAIAAISGARRIGVINSLGQRRDAKAVAVLAPLAAAPDAPTAEAAIVAMGRIGSGEAAKALLALKAPAALELAKTDACLACAAHLLKDGNKAEAETICSSLSGADQPMRVRLAALKGLSQAAPEKAAGPILALLKDKDPALQLMAVKLAADAPSEQMAKALTEGLPAFAPNIQVAVLNALAAGRYKPAASAAIKAVESADESVRAAAVKSLGALGGASEIELLAKQAGGEGAVATEAAGSLERLGGADVNPAMIKAMQSGDAKARAALIRALAARNCSEATPALLAATSDADAAISKAAAKALSDLAGPKDLPKLVDLLIAAKEASQRRALEQTIAMAAAKNENAEERATPVIEGMAKAGDDAKINLLSALKTIGGAKALEAVRAQIKAANANAALRKAGVQALSGWSDAAPLDDLRALAKNDADQSIQILALRGFIQLVALPSKRSSKENVALLSDAITMAKRADEKRAVLGALPAVKCPEAMKLAESLVKDAEVGKEAELAIQTMKLDKALKFDFQPKGAPVMEGFIGVDPAMLFGEETEYGWQTPPGGTRERTAGTNLTRDFILDTAPRKFMVKLSNGEHTVTVYLGDTQSGHDKMQVKAQGQVVVPNATTAAGEVKEFTFKTTVSDGLLTLEFTKAAGSKDANWCCEGVIIK
ncbi:MAG: HEAT repeat domain-containing protein [Candidatus Sumerlaeota bacterium]|nr:HEAT repeat domain-containing protein [Candidatus Sumerlaeota bacterium]